jgi:transcriptional regulator with XRE-family HTH domain
VDTLRRQGIGLGTPGTTSEFAQRILDRAQDLGMNKMQLARRAGISRQTLENLLGFAERDGTSMPAIRTFLLLGQALRVHPAWLMEGLFCNVAVDARIDVHVRPGHCEAVTDLNYPQGVVAAPGTRLTKRWSIRNTSDQVWQGVQLVCQDLLLSTISKRSGDTLHATDSLKAEVDSVALPDLAPGQSTEVAVDFTSPITSGTVISRWLAVGPQGQPLEQPHVGAFCMVHVTTLADTVAFEPLPT